MNRPPQLGRSPFMSAIRALSPGVCILIGAAVIAVAISVGLYIRNEVHGHTLQGRYEHCVLHKYVQSHERGLDPSRAEFLAELKQACRDETGYKP